MHLNSGRWCEPDENCDAITARILTDGGDVEIGLPVANEPKVACLIVLVAAGCEP
jgi:hypothetical protein